MKNRFLILLIVIFTFVGLMGCGNAVSQSEALDIATAYYPEKVSLQYQETGEITDESNQDGFVNQACYLFDVFYEDKIVSSVAIGTKDGSVWFRDMGDDRLWLSAAFMGYPLDESNKSVVTEPFINILSRNEDKGTTTLYFADLDTVPELSSQNEGNVFWDEQNQTITISAMKITGSVTGAPDGPSLSFSVRWVENEPILERAEFSPAPIYSRPNQVIYSEEEWTIESERLLEIATYFRELVMQEIG